MATALSVTITVSHQVTAALLLLSILPFFLLVQAVQQFSSKITATVTAVSTVFDDCAVNAL